MDMLENSDDVKVRFSEIQDFLLHDMGQKGMGLLVGIIRIVCISATEYYIENKDKLKVEEMEEEIIEPEKSEVQPDKKNKWDSSMFG
jgi:hypothetical protein